MYYLRNIISVCLGVLGSYLILHLFFYIQSNSVSSTSKLFWVFALAGFVGGLLCTLVSTNLDWIHNLLVVGVLLLILKFTRGITLEDILEWPIPLVWLGHIISLFGAFWLVQWYKKKANGVTKAPKTHI
jgi:lysylphosphatidylglycerol synthetase-like protein (DUF2156 family)